MSFNLIASYVGNSIVFYDGGERERFPLHVKLAEMSIQVEIDPLAPESSKWRYYYHDSELNELTRLLKLQFEFSCNVEAAVDPISRRRVCFQPFWQAGHELSICYTYDEVSNGHYVFWLVAVLSRNVAESAFSDRVAHIKKYWLK